MKEIINITWGVNMTSGTESITLEDVQCETIEEWEALDEDEQRERLQEALNTFPERTYIVVDSWE